MESIEAALDVASDEHRAYIEKNWKPCTPLWARDSIPLLIQVWPLTLSMEDLTTRQS
jgi:hypothetical protein